MFEAIFIALISNDSTANDNRVKVEVKTKSAIAPEPKVKANEEIETKPTKRDVPKRTSQLKIDPNLKIWILAAGVLIPWLVFSTFYTFYINNIMFINIIIILAVPIVLSATRPVVVKKALIFVTLFHLLTIIIPQRYFYNYEKDFLYEYHYPIQYWYIALIQIIGLVCNMLIVGYLCKKRLKEIQVTTEKKP